MSSSSLNESLFLLITKLLNGSELYKHQAADLIEPEKYSINAIHAVIWTFTILTYLLAMPVVLRMFVSRAYENLIDYFSCQIILCAFIAWIPALILLLHHWFEIFTSSLCRFHYVILSTNETVSCGKSTDFTFPFLCRAGPDLLRSLHADRTLSLRPSGVQTVLRSSIVVVVVDGFYSSVDDLHVGGNPVDLYGCFSFPFSFFSLALLERDEQVLFIQLLEVTARGHGALADLFSSLRARGVSPRLCSSLFLRHAWHESNSSRPEALDHPCRRSAGYFSLLRCLSVLSRAHRRDIQVLRLGLVASRQFLSHAVVSHCLHRILLAGVPLGSLLLFFSTGTPGE